MTADTAAPPVSFDFEAIGTHWQIETPAPLDASVRAAVLERIEAFDAAYSRFRPDSLVTALALGAGSIGLPPDAEPLFTLYDQLFDATGGAVDPLVGRDLELLGYDAAYSLRPAAGSPLTGSPSGGPHDGGSTDGAAPGAPHRAAWPSVIRTPVSDSDSDSGGVTVTAPQGTVLDVGAAGKGYLVDLVAEVLRSHGLTEFVVDASGDLVHAGSTPIRVGLEHPLDPTKAIGVAEIAGAALCASASNRRAWGDGLHHIVDGRTGNPAREVVATWVVARTTALADGLATALFFTGAHQLAKTFHFSYVRMYADGRAERSRDFPGEIFR
ncbi:FAD:protein FMN transferase [Herbiconiux sp. P18]|uniref:FAD:protein FMN transferase n=1 Tax=Herbiconiux liangxiaofengii TaxID=3342795 RepID=UPI0035B84B4F